MFHNRLTSGFHYSSLIIFLECVWGILNHRCFVVLIKYITINNTFPHSPPYALVLTLRVMKLEPSQSYSLIQVFGIKIKSLQEPLLLAPRRVSNFPSFTGPWNANTKKDGCSSPPGALGVYPRILVWNVTMALLLEIRELLLPSPVKVIN